MNIKEPESKCYFYALNYINRYPKTEKELKLKLLEKWYYEDKINETIDFLKSKNYVNDENFAKLYINSEVVKKWKPIFVVKKKLFQKWISKYLIKKITEELQEDIFFWMKTKIENEIKKLKLKWIIWFDIIQKLMRRGYNLYDIKKVIIENNEKIKQ